jgi:predicted nucleotidyltransferase
LKIKQYNNFMTVSDQTTPSSTLLPELEAVVRRLRERLPQLTAILLFGSRASGLADDFSDYDLMVLVPDGLDQAQRRSIGKQLQAEFPSLHLDLIISSERVLLAGLRYEPARAFWLENGISLWGRKPLVLNYPSLARGALLSHLNIIEAEIGVASAAEDEHDRSRVGVEALERSLQIEHALAGDYRNESVRRAVEDMVGSDFIRSVRDPQQPIDPAARRHLFRVTRNKLRALRRRVTRMPENESDRLWREQWHQHESAKTT